MPQQVVVRPEFARAVLEELGGLTPNQASYKTQVSDEWIRKMTNGRVPSEAILQRFADGLGADLTKLRIAAGYQQDPDVEVALEALRGAKTEATRRRMVEALKQIAAEEREEQAKEDERPEHPSG